MEVNVEPCQFPFVGISMSSLSLSPNPILTLATIEENEFEHAFLELIIIMR